MTPIAKRQTGNTLKALLCLLDEYDSAVPTTVLFRALKRFKPVARDLASYLRFNRQGYRRNLIHTGPGYQAWLLCWKKGQISPIHDHTGSACGVRVIRGTATETRFNLRRDGRLTRGRTCQHPVGTVIASVDADIHEMGCLHGATEDLVSLHIYSPALTGMKSYPASLVVGCESAAEPNRKNGSLGSAATTSHNRRKSRSAKAVGKTHRLRRA